MRQLASPMVALARRFKLGFRLGLVALVLLIPTVVLGQAFITTTNGQIGFAQKESDGTAVLGPALSAMADTVGGGRIDMTELSRAVSDNSDLELDQAMSAVQAAANSADDASGRAELASALADLIIEAGNSSNLILDPDLDSYYVMDALVVQIPGTLVAGAKAAVGPAGESNADDVATQAVLAGNLSDRASTITADTDTALANTSWSELNGQLTGLGDIANAAEALNKDLLANLDKPAAADAGSLASAVSQGTPSAVDALDTLLQNRIAGQKHSQTLILSITVISLLVAAWFSIGVLVLTQDDATMTVAAVKALADGDLRAQRLPVGQDEFGNIGHALASATEALRSAMAAISDHAVTLASASEELSATNDSIAAAAEQTTGKAGEASEASQSVNTHTNGLSAAATEFSSSIGEIAQNATEAAHIAASATNLAEQTTQTVDRLGTSSAEITDVIQLIRAVAEQTNLLALNATIEAARAGEAGRGFAVVATEVKDLAQQTETATSDITSRITQIQAESQAAMAAITQIGSVISQISEFQTSIAGAVEEQNATANEMSQQIVVVADSSSEIAENIGTVTEAARVTGEHVTESRTATGELAQMSAELRRQVGQFQL